jgi:hypothetical protein
MQWLSTKRSETELLEEEVGGSLLLASSLGLDVSALEQGLKVSLHGLAGFSVGHALISDNRLEVHILLHDEAGGHHVVVVDELDEGLETALAVNLLLGHALDDTAGRAFNTNDEGVGELLVLASFVVLLDDDSFLSGLATSEEDDNSAFLHTKPQSGKRLFNCRRAPLNAHSCQQGRLTK